MTTSPYNPKYNELTVFIDKLKNADYGSWTTPDAPDDKPNGPIAFQNINYSEVVNEFVESVYEFVDAHPEYEMKKYMEILEKNGIQTIDEVKVDNLDAKTTLAVIMCIIRQERFCDGLILSNLENGKMQNLLMRLKYIDDNFV